jgi:hypothetical protein
MEKILTQLIEEEIRLTALVRSLYKLEIDATNYLPNLCHVIFELANVERTDERSDHYFQLLEIAAETKGKEERQEAVNRILGYLSILN